MNDKRGALKYALVYHDPFDQFAWTQEWRFALADYIIFVLGGSVPNYTPSEPETESYAYEELTFLMPDEEEARYAYNILSRFRKWLALAGEDY